ncbi:SulP family inorganic anion transporter [Bradyrhizobium canariense]|uniref:Sulfate permease, MFS superfamily n=1 Tax=Bradyrhizobium canariense TaxID=255045 RepID=A0A1H2BRA2_9BRAD|nr:solute carrier family 23 protein [Bradyrhizobium canariense]SDT60703.1 Sulfate permease, MFS superfamily [Bradyrhizobium canariense]
MIETPHSTASSHVASSHSWPVLRSLRGYQPSFLTHDLVAGFTLVAIAIPEQLATSRLGGFSPQIGFFAFLAASLAFALFGSNRFLSSGADSTITPIFAGGLALLATSGSPDYVALAGALALLVGAVLVVGGIFRMGWIADLLSIPVTVGFLAGISVHILISQMPGILGLPTPAGPMLQRLATLVEQLPQANLFSLGIGLGVLALVTLCERIDVRIPGALIGLIAAAAATVLMGLESRGVAVLGDIPVALPELTLPDIAITRWLQLVPLALIIAIIIMVQTAATTRSFASAPNQPPDVDRDFIGVGAGSVISGLIGGFPVNASPPRTAIVAETGGKSQLAILVAAAIILGLLAFGGSLLRHVPQAALGGVLLFVAMRIIRISQIVSIYRQSIGELFLVVATAAAIIVLPIEQGVAIGITLSLLHGIWSNTRARVTPYERVPGTSIWWPSHPKIPGKTEADVVVAGFQAPLSFLNAYHFRSDLMALVQASPQPPRLIVLESTGIVEIDFTAAQILSDTISACHAEGISFAIARLESERAQKAIERFGILPLLAKGQLFRSVEEAIKACSDEAKS